METKYRVSILVEKLTKNDMTQQNEVIMEHNTSYDDFKTSNRLFIWLVKSLSEFKMENEK